MRAFSEPLVLAFKATLAAVEAQLLHAAAGLFSDQAA
jgi:hypothetical protein